MAKIIVEVCQNHNGSREILKEMIHKAVEAGADIIKGQVIFAEDLTPRDRFEEGEELHNGVRKTIKRPYQPEFDRLSKLDLTPDDYAFFVKEVRRAGAVPMLAVFSRNRIPMTASLPWGGESWVKVPSYDCASYPYLRELAENFDHLVVSTGASFDHEIEKAAEILKNSGKHYALLHCVTNYPNTHTQASLSRLNWLKNHADEVGWSDHSLVSRDGLNLAKIALTLGADYIERHFTILSAGETKDGPVSITPEQLKELVRFANLSKDEQKRILEEEIPHWREALGHPNREMTHTEMLNRDYYRGRFASNIGGEWIHNWEDKTL